MSQTTWRVSGSSCCGGTFRRTRWRRWTSGSWLWATRPIRSSTLAASGCKRGSSSWAPSLFCPSDLQTIRYSLKNSIFKLWVRLTLTHSKQSIQLSTLTQMSVVIGQRPRNYLSCCSLLFSSFPQKAWKWKMCLQTLRYNHSYGFLT